jgi:hypothetical protein
MTVVPGGTTMDENYMVVACWDFMELTAMSVINNLLPNQSSNKQ